jgi:hypothetical protein
VSSIVDGLWSIDTIYYKQYDIRGCLLSNVISFDGDNCNLATTGDCEGLYVIEEVGEWQMNEKRDILSINIDTKNEIFAGHHYVKLKRDMNLKLLKMEIWSDSLYIVCRKGLYNIDYHKDELDSYIN